MFPGTRNEHLSFGYLGRVSFLCLYDIEITPKILIVGSMKKVFSKETTV